MSIRCTYLRTLRQPVSLALSAEGGLSTAVESFGTKVRRSILIAKKYTVMGFALFCGSANAIEPRPVPQDIPIDTLVSLDSECSFRIDNQKLDCDGKMVYATFKNHRMQIDALPKVAGGCRLTTYGLPFHIANSVDTLFKRCLKAVFVPRTYFRNRTAVINTHVASGAESSC